MPRAATVAAVIVVWSIAAVAGAGQLGALVSPGPLSAAHAPLSGAANCVKCHEAGRRVSAPRCLSCHQPIADRIAKKSGVHRAVTGGCDTCHSEHAGAGADLRHLDTKTFDHAAETGFALDGRHAALAKNCAACHKKRSFLDAKPACASCHTDVHKGTLGVTCVRCHSTAAAFKSARTQFDHAQARFALTGAHREVTCEKCHAGGVYRGLRFDSCASCHQTPHRKVLGPACSACHTTAQWATRTVDHAKTRFPLVGAHAQTPCVSCHVAGMTAPLRSERCTVCHTNVHRDSIKDDCRACHTEKTFRVSAAFDHQARTGFALEGRHVGLACVKCHTTRSAGDVPLARKVIDFGGAPAECASCHVDPHKNEFGRTCDGCHRPAGFSVKGFTHPKASEFYEGQHAGVACVKCHKPGAIMLPVRTALAPPALRAARPSTACATCHADVHFGQVGLACETCHAVDAPKFAARLFSHDRTAFALTGKHQTLACAKCHTTEVQAYPAGTGRAMRLKPMSSECRTCHQDPHLGQVEQRCQACHSEASFAVPNYTHRGLADFFAGFHGKLACAACHKKETGAFPAGRGTTVRFRVGTTCRACHPNF
jgi:hypothetical protein